MGSREIIGHSWLCKCKSSRSEHDGVQPHSGIGLAHRFAQTAGAGVVNSADVVTGTGNRSGHGIVKAVNKECRIGQRHQHRWGDFALM